MAESSSYTYFHPVCFGCGKPFWLIERLFPERLQEELLRIRNLPPEEEEATRKRVLGRILDDLDIQRYCCRMNILTPAITAPGAYVPLTTTGSEVAPLAETAPGITMDPELARIIRMTDFTARNYSSLPGALNATMSSHISLGSRIQLSPKVTVLEPTQLAPLATPSAKLAPLPLSKVITVKAGAAMVPLKKAAATTLAPLAKPSAAVSPATTLAPLAKPSAAVSPATTLAPLAKPSAATLAPLAKPSAVVSPAATLAPLAKPSAAVSPVATLAPLAKPSATVSPVATLAPLAKPSAAVSPATTAKPKPPPILVKTGAVMKPIAKPSI